MPLHVLYVCTGNVCRSPMAEVMFRASALRDGSVETSSAGIGALVGEPVDGSSADALGEYGLDAAGHRARQFEPWMASQAGLVLTAQRMHRDAVMAMAPEAWRRTFTMREFARLATAVAQAEPDAGPYTVVARAAAGRGMFGAVPLEADDIADPYRRDLDFARGTARRIHDTVRLTLAGLSAAAPAPPPPPTSPPVTPPRPPAPPPLVPPPPAGPPVAPRPAPTPTPAAARPSPRRRPSPAATAHDPSSRPRPHRS